MTRLKSLWMLGPRIRWAWPSRRPELPVSKLSVVPRPGPSLKTMMIASWMTISHTKQPFAPLVLVASGFSFGVFMTNSFQAEFGTDLGPECQACGSTTYGYRLASTGSVYVAHCQCACCHALSEFHLSLGAVLSRDQFTSFMIRRDHEREHNLHRISLIEEVADV